MVLLGHPVFTGGRYQGDQDHLIGEWSPPLLSPFALGGNTEPFTALHRLLKEHKVKVVMAGDMHYFEHYQEKYTTEGTTHMMHHFVNGGGAYVFIGLPFDWPRVLDSTVPVARRRTVAGPAIDSAAGWMRSRLPHRGISLSRSGRSYNTCRRVVMKPSLGRFTSQIKYTVAVTKSTKRAAITTKCLACSSDV